MITRIFFSLSDMEEHSDRLLPPLHFKRAFVISFFFFLKKGKDNAFLFHGAPSTKEQGVIVHLG